MKRKTRFQSERQPAFTLVELLVVIAIIGMLVALLLPAVQAAARGRAADAMPEQLKQIALGVLNYESTFRRIPASAIVNLNVAVTGNNESWGVHGRILNFLEQNNLNDLVDSILGGIFNQ